ncbi:hypothetical protein RA27_22115 [Ruegeria sp. ANG-R]|uniref:hypothetical protein n=1 Tax=Ruegeria sp. ANG-R TaxID=1577903 RepID=UPI00057C6C7C|nr:hypothetical protein [Ruegeria sp. ANG-R]KIC36454.1 hypothetical protein RA27_22115 [Ruegeria sp. ANG-R]
MKFLWLNSSLAAWIYLSLVTTALASWENNCLLTGIVVSDVTEFVGYGNKDGTAEFSLLVLGASKYGRADSGCLQFIGTTQDVVIATEFANFRKGLLVQIVRLENDYAFQSGEEYGGPDFMISD